MLNIDPLSIKSFANIFSYSVGRLHFVKWFLCYAKAFVFIKSHLFIFAFISFTLGGGLKKKYWGNLCQSALPVFL